MRCRTRTPSHASSTLDLRAGLLPLCAGPRRLLSHGRLLVALRCPRQLLVTHRRPRQLLVTHRRPHHLLVTLRRSRLPGLRRDGSASTTLTVPLRGGRAASASCCRRPGRSTTGADRIGRSWRAMKRPQRQG